MKTRIAVILDEDIYSQRGMFNSIRNRIKHLNRLSGFDIDVYVVGCYEPWYICKLRHTRSVKKIKSMELDGIEYHTLWYNFTLIDYFLEVKLHLSPLFSKLYYRCLVRKIKGYDLVSAHSTNCGLLASRISKRDGIPFCVTWHGSDIHTTPFRNKTRRRIVEKILSSASCNFFVSETLKNVGLTIVPNLKYKVLYNGRDELFQEYTPEKRHMIREHYGIPVGTKLIAFVGNLLGVKNPQLLAPIFSAIQKKYDKPLLFWVIGSGKMQKEVEQGCEQFGVKCVFWGAQPAEQMPDFMNCMDVLILPSRNEGLPLVVVEAIACGANVVGSDVGGISEAIGEDNVFPHGDNFIENISDRVIYMLTHKVAQPLSKEFEWSNTAQKELAIYNQLLSNN